MAYIVPPDLDARLQAQLASGEFSTVDAVLHQALDALENRQQSLARLRGMVQEADEDIALGRIGTFDVTETMRAVLARIEAERAT